MRLSAALAALLTFQAALVAQLSPAQSAEVEQISAAAMSRARIPALSVAVVTANGEIWARAWGFTDLENHVPATTQSVFRLASVSKPFTAAAAMALAEKGTLDLDTEIQRYVLFPPKKWPVTTRQLLGHLGGVRHYNGQDFNSTRHYNSVYEALSLFASDPLLHEPGTKYLYSSYGFNLAGAVVERAARRPFADLVKELILTPLGLETVRTDDLYTIIPFRARGYRIRKDGVLQNCDLADTSNKIPGGGWVANASDLVRFAHALASGRLLREESLTAMWTRGRLKSGEQTGYGLGWNIADLDGVPVVQHSGGQQGANTHLLLVPSRKIAVAVLTNLEDAGATSIATSIMRVILKENP